jgi:hypothetical protein
MIVPVNLSFARLLLAVFFTFLAQSLPAQEQKDSRSLAPASGTWDGRYAMPFCAALDQPDDQERCFKDSVDYLRTIFEKSSEEIRTDCLRHTENSRRCTELAQR